MNYGLYLSAQGADAQSQRLDVISNNLANAQTGAFKRDLAIFQAHRPFDVENGAIDAPPGGLNGSTGGVTLSGVVTDFSEGSTIATGGTYDLAVQGPGFLNVTNGNEEFLTRNGRLTIDDRGELALADSGHAVLAADGRRIALPNDSRDVEISADGTIVSLNDAGVRSLVAKLDVVVPESHADLQKVGNSLYRNLGESRPAGDRARVLQGHLESSGTHPVGEMMQMIEASRAFEANVNMIRYQDESLGRLLQAIPRR